MKCHYIQTSLCLIGASYRDKDEKKRHRSKTHIGDDESGLMHRVAATADNVASLSGARLKHACAGCRTGVPRRSDPAIDCRVSELRTFARGQDQPCLAGRDCLSLTKHDCFCGEGINPSHKGKSHIEQARKPIRGNINLSHRSVTSWAVAHRTTETCKNATFLVDLRPLTP